jgi:hypothetical protein
VKNIDQVKANKGEAHRGGPERGTDADGALSGVLAMATWKSHCNNN